MNISKTIYATWLPPSLEEQAILCRIGESPNDMSLRLVYSDWLEERGRSSQATFIRANIENDIDSHIPGSQRGKIHWRSIDPPFEEWHCQTPEEWWKFPCPIHYFSIDRGFLFSLALHQWHWFEYFDKILMHHPVLRNVTIRRPEYELHSTRDVWMVRPDPGGPTLWRLLPRIGSHRIECDVSSEESRACVASKFSNIDKFLKQKWPRLRFYPLS